MPQEFLGDHKPKRFRREVSSPTARLGEGIEQAHAAVFLASDESSFVNATDFLVDGVLAKAYVTRRDQLSQAPGTRPICKFEACTLFRILGGPDGIIHRWS